MSEENDNVALLDEERKKRRELIENKTSEKFRKQLQTEDRETVKEALARIAPPIIVEPRCSVCAGPYAKYRQWIEHEIILGRSYRSIANNIAPEPGHNPLDRRAIANHFEKHMMLDEAVIRGILEEEAMGIAQNFHEGVQGAITDRGIVKGLLQKGWEDVINGLTTVEPKDMVPLLKLSKEYQTGNADTQFVEAENAVRMFMDAIKTVLLSGTLVSREQGQEILLAVREEVKEQRQRDDNETPVESHLLLDEGVVDAEVIA